VGPGLVANIEWLNRRFTYMHTSIPLNLTTIMNYGLRELCYSGSSASRSDKIRLLSQRPGVYSAVETVDGIPNIEELD